MHTADGERMATWAAEGLWEGSKWGFKLGLLYSSVVVLISLRVSSVFVYGSWQLCFPFTGFFVYVAPVIGIGAIWGSIVGVVSALPFVYKAGFLRIMLALSITILLITGNFWMVIAENLNYYEVLMNIESAYPLYPGALYIVGPIMSIWISSRIPGLSGRRSPSETVATEQCVDLPVGAEQEV